MNYRGRFPMIPATFVLFVAVTSMVSSGVASARVSLLSTARHDPVASVSATPASVQAMFEYPAVAASSVISSNTDYTLVAEEELTPTIATVGVCTAAQG
jgi:hypothetical protein